MLKQNGINKSLLSTENIVNSSNYENFAMQLLNRKDKGTNVIALTCDIKTSDITAIVCLNVGFNLIMFWLSTWILTISHLTICWKVKAMMIG